MKPSIVCRHYDVRMVPIQCTSCGGSFLVCPRCSPGRICPACEGKAPLTRRELEVLALIARGVNNKEISSLLNITIPTVKNHVMSIFRKMGAQNRVQAAVGAIKRGLVPMPEKIGSEEGGSK